MKKPFHPFLISAYFVLALLGLNVDQVKISASFRSLVFSILAAIILWGLLRLLLRDWDKAAIITSLYLLLFFSYGHVYHLLELKTILGVMVGRHRLLIPLWIFLSILITWVVLKKVKDLRNFHVYLNALGIVALVFPLYQVTSYALQSASLARSAASEVPSEGTLHFLPGQRPPDIYYIILDSYARKDALEKLVGFDNSDFLERLGEIGFYVAECSQSNYAQTSLSVASALNYNYLDALSDDLQAEDTKATKVLPFLSHSAARRELEDLGYSFVTFENPYYWLRITDSDYYYSFEKSAVNKGEELLPVNSFEAMFLRESAAVILTDSVSLFSRFMFVDMDYPNKSHRELILYTFDKLTDIPTKIPGPKFIYVHFVSPHAPIVFDRYGEYVQIDDHAPDEIFTPAYADQIRYLNQRILDLIQNIIDVSANPPVIILQADHGYDRSPHSDRVSILNAYFLPGGGEKLLYPGISPVNTFRVIFNYYYDGQLPLLEDKAYYSQYGKPYIYTLIPNDCPYEKP